ncbi:MAG: Protein YchN [Calditrichaeota bacterium]|nr:Protein YchN [Calditrichota bacterium]
MNALFILNDPPYGTERTYNGLRLARNLQRMEETVAVTIFLIADAVFTAKAGQQTPNGYYNLERMLKGLVRHGGRVLLCGTCMDARGLVESEIIDGAN